MSRYIDVNKQLVRLYRLNLFCEDTIKQFLLSADTVDAEPVRHGYWVHGKELSRDYIGDVCVSIHYDKCWCSECNYTVEGYPLLWKYCPICGAKMDGGEEHE